MRYSLIVGDVSPGRAHDASISKGGHNVEQNGGTLARAIGYGRVCGDGGHRSAPAGRISWMQGIKGGCQEALTCSLLLAGLASSVVVWPGTCVPKRGGTPLQHLTSPEAPTSKSLDNGNPV